MINERFDVINAKENGEATVVPSVEPTEPTPKTNGAHALTSNSASSSPTKREPKSESVSDVVDAPPKKKRKASIDADAVYAARLQAEEDARARPTRGGTSRKAGPVKKKKKAKKEKVTGSDDSDIVDEDKPQKPKRETGFHVGDPVHLITRG